MILFVEQSNRTYLYSHAAHEFLISSSDLSHCCCCAVQLCVDATYG
jgi:hypothetical protein